jgi:hypothetical protein
MVFAMYRVAKLKEESKLHGAVTKRKADLKEMYNTCIIGNLDSFIFLHKFLQLPVRIPCHVFKTGRNVVDKDLYT